MFVPGFNGKSEPAAVGLLNPQKLIVVHFWVDEPRCESLPNLTRANTEHFTNQKVYCPAKKVIWYNYQDLGHDQQWLYDKDTSDMPEND